MSVCCWTDYTSTHACRGALQPSGMKGETDVMHKPLSGLLDMAMRCEK